MSKIPTAKDFFCNHTSHSASEIMIEFTKFHVEAALKEASKKALADFDEGGATGFVDEDSILNCYPLINIK